MLFDKNTQTKFDRMNLDENKVKLYKIPDVLQAESAFEWYNKIRPYYLNEFKDFMYGAIPPRPDIMKFELLDCKKSVFNDLARRKIIRLHFEMQSGAYWFADMLLYIPNNVKNPPPVFMGLNFKSNASCTFEKDIPLSHIKPLDMGTPYYDISPTTEHNRGEKASRWPFETILKRGYAVATCYYNDFFLDVTHGFSESIFSLFVHSAPKESSDNPKEVV
jgi:hypothetical protein